MQFEPVESKRRLLIVHVARSHANSLRDIYGPGHAQADYLAPLAAGYETDW